MRIRINDTLQFDDFFTLHKWIKKLSDDEKKTFLCYCFQKNIMTEIPKKHVFDFYLLFDLNIIRSALNSEFTIFSLIESLPAEQRLIFLFNFSEKNELDKLIKNYGDLVKCLEAFADIDRNRVLTVLRQDFLKRSINTLDAIVAVMNSLYIEHTYVFLLAHQELLKSLLHSENDLFILVKSVLAESTRYYLLFLLRNSIREMRIPFETMIALIQCISESDRLPALSVLGAAVSQPSALSHQALLSLFSREEIDILHKAKTQATIEKYSEKSKIKLFQPAVIQRQPKNHVKSDDLDRETFSHH